MVNPDSTSVHSERSIQHGESLSQPGQHDVPRSLQRFLEWYLVRHDASLGTGRPHMVVIGTVHRWHREWIDFWCEGKHED